MGGIGRFTPLSARRVSRKLAKEHAGPVATVSAAQRYLPLLVQHIGVDRNLGFSTTELLRGPVESAGYENGAAKVYALDDRIDCACVPRRGRRHGWAIKPVLRKKAGILFRAVQAAAGSRNN